MPGTGTTAEPTVNRRLAGVLAGLLLTAGAALAAEPARQPAAGSAPSQVALLWWPATPAGLLDDFSRQSELCLVGGLAAGCTELVFAPAESTRELLGPLYDPAAQPQSEEAFAALVTGKAAQARLRAGGIRYLIALSGGKLHDTRGGLTCGAGHAAGECRSMVWVNRDVRLGVLVLDLAGSGPVGQPEASGEPGRRNPPPMAGEFGVCRELTRQIIDFLRARPKGEECRRPPGA